MVDFQTREWQKGQKLLAADMNDQESRIATAFSMTGTGGGSNPGIEVPAFGDPVGQTPGEWTPVFGDDFDGAMNVVDASTGEVQFGDGPLWRTRLGGAGTTDNGRTFAPSISWFDTSQVSQSGSSVFLRASYQPDSSRPNNPYLTGMLEPSSFSQVHGFIEARIKNPYLKGSYKSFGMRAVGMLQPRVDALKQYSDLGDQKITTWKNDQTNVPGSLNEQYVGWSKDWMTVGIEWTEDELIFYIDGTEITRDSNRESVPDRPMRALAMFLIDGSETGVDSTKYPASIEIDYIRSWQKPEPTTLLLEDRFTSLNNWEMRKGTITASGDGTAVIQGVAGQWTNGLSAYLKGMPAADDIDVTFDFRIPIIESYTSLAWRSDGTESGAGPIAAYGMVWAPQNGIWDLERFDYSGNGSVIMGTVNYDYGDANTWHTARIFLDGGQMKAKVWRRGTDEPEAWGVDYTMGADKNNDYVMFQAGKAFLSSLNGNSGEARAIGIGNFVINTAAQPEPVPFTKMEGGDGSDDGIEVTSRYGAYTLSGATGEDNNGTDLTSIRMPVMLPKKAKRLRIHVTNRMGLSDYNMPNGPSILKATFGPRNTAAGANELALKSVQTFPAGSGSMDNGGEWVSGWLTPEFDTTDYAWISLLAQFTGTNVTVSYSGHGFYANNPSDITSDLSGNGWVDYGVTPFNSYIEYEYEDDGKEQVLFIGDSIPEGYVEGGKPGAADSNMRTWAGHITSYPETFGRHRAQVAVNNSYASAKLNDWTASSVKWTRFDKMEQPFSPGAVVIHLGGNDLFGGQAWNTIYPEMEQLLRDIKSKYPKARTFIMGMMPLLATSGEGATGFQNRVKLNTAYATIDRALLDGYIDPNNGIYDPATGANENVQPKYCSFDGLHLAPGAYELIAAAINI